MKTPLSIDEVLSGIHFDRDTSSFIERLIKNLAYLQPLNKRDTVAREDHHSRTLDQLADSTDLRETDLRPA